MVRYYPALLLVVIRSEKELCERFGEESEPYRRQMPSFFPHL
jgi:protein-S-isoprenylcysteine O-methyltransferase Ste14